MKKIKISVIVLCLLLVFVMASCGTEKNEGGTNTQESTVDEGDIVKIGNDGLIYNSQSDGITVTQTNNGQMNVIASYSRNHYIPKEMFINGNYLITIGCTDREFTKNMTPDYDYYHSKYSDVTVNVFNMASVKTMAFGDTKVLLNNYSLYTFTISGQYYTSRLFSETKELYVIFNYENYIERETIENQYETTYKYNKTQISYKENENTKNLSDISEIKDLEAKHYGLDAILFMKIKLTDQNISAVTKGYYGADFKTLYMSENALYPVFELYNYKRSGCGGSNLPYTHILKLNLDDLQSPNQINLNYSTIYDRFALKDFGDYLYVCTSFGNNGFTVTAYDSQLNEKGSIEKIAAGEDIKSVTYQEADNCRYCYITTYRNTDPLFKVDITNPEDMNLLGSLSITGYSTYMLTLSDSYMVSIGYDGDNRSADNSVLKVSLYGVSNGNLTLIDYMTVSGILNCEALTNSKAIAVSKENLMFGFSVLKEGSIYSQGYYVFNIKDGGLNDLAYITNNVNGFSKLYFDNFRTFIRRAFVYNGYAYFISDSQICSYSIALFSENKDAFVNSVSTVIE